MWYGHRREGEEGEGKRHYGHVALYIPGLVWPPKVRFPLDQTACIHDREGAETA